MDKQKQQIISLIDELSIYKKKIHYASMKFFEKATSDASLIIIKLQAELIETLKNEIERIKSNKQKL